MSKLLCFRVVVFGRYCAVLSMRMRIRSGGLLCLFCCAARPSCACVYEVTCCSACCVMLCVPLAHVYTKWRVVVPVLLSARPSCACVYEVTFCSACCVMLRVPLAHVYTKGGIVLRVVLCCASLLLMPIRSDELFCLLCYAARPSCACVYEGRNCSTCCVMLCVPLALDSSYNLFQTLSGTLCNKENCIMKIFIICLSLQMISE
jgi:hypothetical protein